MGYTGFMTKYGKYPDAFYRVSVKAVIRNDKREVLCVAESERDFWELPGGGIDHGETIKRGLARELQEEIGYVGHFTYLYADATPLFEDMSGRCVMYVAFDVILDQPDDISLGNGVYQMEYRDPRQFKDVDYRGGQMIYKHAVDHTFPIMFDRRAEVIS